MKFSIIVVSLNPGERLIKTVKSILAQSYADYEVVIKDGGSKDSSLQAVRDINDARISIYERSDKSIYDAMNQAIEYAKGEYFIFLNCGDLFENPYVLEKMEEAISKENADILYGDLKREDTNGIIPSPNKITDFVCYRNIPCHQVCFYKANLFEERAYDTKYPVRADYEHFLYCIYKRNAGAIYVPITVCLYEGDGFSETKEHEKAAVKEHREITKIYLGNKCLLYKLVMVITLQPLRKRMSKTGIYQWVKRVIYGR